MKETPGTKAAREIRAKCNNMTREERDRVYENSINIIYKYKTPMEWFKEVSELKRKYNDLKRKLENLVSNIEEI